MQLAYALRIDDAALLEQERMGTLLRQSTLLD